MSGRLMSWVTLGWAGVWILFIVFHVLYFTNHMEGLLWVTLVSVGPLWLFTAIGGLVVSLSLLIRPGPGPRATASNCRLRAQHRGVQRGGLAARGAQCDMCARTSGVWRLVPGALSKERDA